MSHYSRIMLMRNTVVLQLGAIKMKILGHTEPLKLQIHGELCVLRGLSWLYEVRLHLPVPDATESESACLGHLCSTVNFCQHH